MVLLPVEEVGTSDMVTVAAAAVVAAAGEVSGSKVMADPVGHDLEVAGLEEVDHLVVVAVTVVAVVAGALAAAAAVLAAVVAALVPGAGGSQAGLEGPADFEDLVLAAVEAAVAEERRRAAVLAETVGAGYKEVDLE